MTPEGVVGQGMPVLEEAGLPPLTLPRAVSEGEEEEGEEGEAVSRGGEEGENEEADTAGPSNGGPAATITFGSLPASIVEAEAEGGGEGGWW